MKNSKIFLAPRLTGLRFEDHTLPVNILEDFTALEELIFELAKQIYLDDNPLRRRVPKGFTDGISLKLSSISEGSTIVNLILVTALTTSPMISDINPDSFTYLEKSKNKILEVISEANKQGDIIKSLDQKYLNYFNRIGKNLKDDEYISFDYENAEKPIKLDKNIRKKILLSRNEKIEYSETITVNALIPLIDKQSNTFIFEIEGNNIPYPLDKNDDFYETIFSTFNEYENKTLVSLKATGIYNSQDKLIRVEAIESMDILDPFDVNVRLNELSKLNDNWYEGYGKAPKNELLNKFGEYFKLYYNLRLPLPSIFPTIDGNIQLEWSNNSIEINLEVNLSQLDAEYLHTNLDIINEKKLDLSSKDGWEDLNLLIKAHI